MRFLRARRHSHRALVCALIVAQAACPGGGGDCCTPPQVASVRVTTPAPTLEAGSTAQLTATPMDGSGNALAGRPVSWTTSSDVILTVSASGLARGVSPGIATATATAEGKSGSVQLTVVAPPAIGISASSATFSATTGGANPASQSVSVTNTGGGTLSGLTASVTYGANQPTGWLSATLSGTTAPATLTLAATTGSLSAGTYTATVAIASSRSDVASKTIAIELTLGPPPAATVAVTPATASVIVGQTTQLAATVRDAAGNVLTGRTVTWTSSNGAIATVSGTGVVTGVAVGSATITATSEGKSGTAAITVTPVPVASVVVSPATASVIVGATVQLTATPRDAANNPLTGRTVSWATSNASIATVSQSGLVTGVAAGSATITATSEGKSGTAAITVTAPPAQIAAGSIVYIKGGNVWLSDPSGTVRRQLTSDGRYRSPSMADDGTIGVLREPEGRTGTSSAGTEFVRLSPTGTRLGSFTWTFSNTLNRAALSPDGRTFAHVYHGVCAYRTGGVRACLRLAFTPSDRYEEVERTGTFDSMDYVDMVWWSNERLVVTGGLVFFNVEIYVRGPGVDLQSPDRFDNTAREHKIFSAALTPDVQRMVTYHRRFMGYEDDGVTDKLGPHEIGVYRHTGPMQYQFELGVQTVGIPTGPTISPDGKAWAFADERGVLLRVFGTSELRLVDPDGREPSWGPYIVK